MINHDRRRIIEAGFEPVGRTVETRSHLVVSWAVQDRIARDLNVSIEAIDAFRTSIEGDTATWEFFYRPGVERTPYVSKPMLPV